MLAIRLAQRNYYSDELSSHGERIEKIDLHFLWSLLAMRRVVGNLSIAQFTLKLTAIDNFPPNSLYSKHFADVFSCVSVETRGRQDV